MVKTGRQKALRDLDSAYNHVNKAIEYLSRVYRVAIESGHGDIAAALDTANQGLSLILDIIRKVHDRIKG